MGIAGPKLRVRLLDSGDERDCNASDIPLQNSSAAGVEVSRWLEVGGQAAAAPSSKPTPAARAFCFRDYNTRQAVVSLLLGEHRQRVDTAAACLSCTARQLLLSR